MKIQSNKQSIAREVNPYTIQQFWEYNSFEENLQSYPVIDQNGNSVPEGVYEAELVEQVWCSGIHGEEGRWIKTDADMPLHTHRMAWEVILPQVEEEKPQLNGLWSELNDIHEQLAKSDLLTDQYNPISLAIIHLKEKLRLNGWIDVKTKLPETGRHVLVGNTESDIVKIGFYNQSDWHVYESATFEVTHWQETPEPPKV